MSKITEQIELNIPNQSKINQNPRVIHKIKWGIPHPKMLLSRDQEEKFDLSMCIWFIKNVAKVVKHSNEILIFQI